MVSLLNPAQPSIMFLGISSIIATPAVAQANHQLPIGPGSTIVKSQFGGQIFGFDIDQNGTEGLLSEAQDLGGGTRFWPLSKLSIKLPVRS